MTPDVTEGNHLFERVKGRVAFLRDKGAVKDPELYEALLARLSHSREAVPSEAERKLKKIAEHPDTPELIRQYAAGMLDFGGEK